MILIYILVFVSGAVLGSFLNVVIRRLKVDKKGTRINLLGRSRCLECGRELAPRDLIPIISFFLLKGKCRFCGAKISLQYPIVETISALLPVLIIWQFGLSNINSWVLIFSSYILLLIFFFDLNNEIIPDVLLWPLAFLGIFYQALISPDLATSYFDLIYGVLIGGGLFLIFVILSKEKWMGMGDVKLGAVLGIFVSFPQIIVVLFSAFILGSLVSLFLIGIRKKTLKSQIPFGPFLILGFFFSVFWGERIINWYLGFI